MPNPFGRFLERAPPSGTFGLKKLCDPGDSVALVDIVFIHGLTGRWDETWTCTEGGTSVFWPMDLLSGDVENARIFSFGYDADAVNLRHRVSNETVSSHADSLLLKLERERRTEATKTRRIVFVAHSLGGLVVEKALCLSQYKAEPHLRRIAESTMGMMFFGTPHLGADLAVWAKAGAELANVLRKNNSRIVGVLEPSSEMLADIRDGLGELFRIRYESRDSLFIACFWEALPVTGVGEIVSRQSAIWPGHYKTAIHADHMNMTKFASIEEEGYKDFLGELQRWLEERNLNIKAPDQPPENPQPASSNTRIQQNVARPAIAPANQDYRGLLDTSSNQPVEQENSSCELQDIGSGGPSGSTYGGTRDSMQYSGRMIDSSDHKYSDLNLRQLNFDDANSLNISDSTNRGEASKPREYTELRVELVAQAHADDSRILRGTLFHQTLVLRNPGPGQWPASFSVSHSRPELFDFPVTKTKSGEVKTGEEIGVTFLMESPQYTGPFVFDIFLTTFNGVPFGPLFRSCFMVVEEDIDITPRPVLFVAQHTVPFRTDSLEWCSAKPCVYDGPSTDCFVSEAFVVRHLHKAADILDHVRHDQEKKIDFGRRVHRSVGTIRLQWRPVGEAIERKVFYVIPGNPFFEVILSRDIYNSTVNDTLLSHHISSTWFTVPDVNALVTWDRTLDTIPAGSIGPVRFQSISRSSSSAGHRRPSPPRTSSTNNGQLPIDLKTTLSPSSSSKIPWEIPQGHNLKRLKRELEAIAMVPAGKFACNPLNEDMYHLQAYIRGPAHTPYSGGTFAASITIPSRYPFVPPKIKLETRIYHMNFINGQIVDLDNILKTDKWSPSFTILKVLDIIYSMLQEPQPDGKALPELVALYREDRDRYEAYARKWTQKYAV
ncbi:hypothetical protein MMC18_006031 [Xylographa bjoerkii]|nr:hypothetical protein [Xylographa bjoerkii]